MTASIVFILVATWLLLVLLMYFFQARFVYFPSQEHAASPTDAGLDYEELYLTTKDDIAIHAWYIPKVDASHTLLFFHGNAGNISHRLDSLTIFHEMGLSVLIIDYRGYGLSTGRPHETGTYADAEAAWDYLTRQRGLSAQQIVILGRSLGGGIASWLAQEKGPAAVILESTFTSVSDVGAGMYPYMPVRWLSRIRYPNIDRVKLISSPILIVHSPDDELIPFHHGQSLYEHANAPKSFLQLSGGHNDGYLLDRDYYLGGLSRFLHEHLYPGERIIEISKDAPDIL